MNNILRYLLLSSCLLIAIQLIGQPTDCIDFTELEIGTIFDVDTGVSPGDVIYEYEGVNLLMNQFLSLNGELAFDQVAVVEEFGDQLEAPSLYVNYSNVTFQYPQGTPVLCFNGTISGHEVNFGLNGQTFVFENFLDPVLPEQFPDFEIQITSTGGTNGSIVAICIFGPIESFTVGGIELIIDDVCTEMNTSCAFVEPNLQAYCQNNNAYSVSIDFEAIIGDNSFVDVFIDNELQGFYSIDAFPLVLENVIPQAQQEEINVTVCINDAPDPSCCYSEDLILSECSVEGCITFDNMGTDTLFNANTGVEPGDVIYEYDPADLVMDIFNTADGSLLFGTISVIEEWSGQLEPPSLYIEHATAVFHYEIPVTEVCFNTILFGQEINFGINGSVGSYQGNLDDELIATWEEYDLTITPLNPNSTAIQFCFSGVIENFTYGGGGVFLDDVCSGAPICDIRNLQVGQYACDEDVQPYLFYLNFEHNQAEQDSFDLIINGEFYGRYAYGDLPLSELEAEVVAGTVIHFLVEDADNEACAEDLTIVGNTCEAACSDFVATAGEVLCVEPFAFSAQLILSTPPTGQNISLYSLTTGNLLGIRTYNNWGGVSFIIDNEFDPEGYLVVDELTGCETTFPGWDFNPEECLQCEISDLSVVPTDCNPNNVYSVTIDLNSTNEVAPLYVVIDGDQTYGPFLPSEFPVTVGTLVGDPDAVVSVEIFSEIGNCNVFAEFIHSCNDCNDFQAELVFVDCSNNNTALVQLLVFGVEEGEPLRITSLSDPNFVQEIIFESNPVQLLVPLNNNNSPSLQFLVEAQGIGCESVTNDLTLSPDCLFCTDFVAEPLGVECFSVDSLLVNFELYGIEPGEPLRITTGPPNNTFITEMTFAGNPISVLAPLTGSNTLSLVIQAQGLGCETTVIFSVPEECLEMCDDFSVDIQNIECYENSPYVELQIVLTGIEPNGQEILIQNINTGTFLPVQFTGNPLQVAWPTADEGILRFVELGNGCVTEVAYEAPEDCNRECDEQFDVVEVACNGGEIIIYFTAEGPQGLPFFVRAFGNEIPFVYGQDIYELILPSQNGLIEFELRFRDQQAGCVQEIIVNNPCFCFIEILAVETTECNDNGEFFVELVFTGATSWGDSEFLVQAGGYTELFPEGTSTAFFGPFPSGAVDILITELSNGLCAEFVVVEQTCEPVECEIFDLVVEGTECDANGNYFIDIDFEANLDGIYVITNEATGESIHASLNDLPVQFGPYNISEIQTSVFVIFHEMTGGCLIEEFHVQECEPQGECGFTNIMTEVYECDGDQFMVDVEFDNPNGGSLGFYIFGDGMIFGPYQYGETFYTFGPLNGSEAEHDILLLDIANPACFGNYDFNYSCSDECNILEVIATPTECDGEFFWVELDVEGNNLGESFSVVGNGTNYGTFNYADLPITLGPFAGDAETSYEFGVIDLQNPGCSNFTEIEPVNCLPCDIRDLVYEVDCGSDFYALTIDFIYENPVSDGFLLQIGGQTVESFSYDQLPITIDLPFNINGDIIRVEDLDNELCGETIDFDIPCCTLGNAINELEVEECESNGEYYFTVNNFTGGNLSDSLVINYAPAGSSIIATEVVSYGSLPVQIGPLSGDGATAYIVVLNDQENDCAVTTTIDPVFCDNDACVEFEGIEGVFAPAFGYDSGDEITTENDVTLTYERNPSTNCACNLFVTDGIPGVDFGSGHIVATQNSGFALDFSDVTTSFNTVNIDYYYAGGEFGISVNGEATIIVGNLNDLPLNIATGVELQVSVDANTDNTGMLTFSGDNIEQILLFTDESAGFDNVCLSMDDNVWPGDTNSDNIADHVDLLSIGLAYGNTGPSRNNVNSEWTGLISQNWGNNFADGTNYKHADANGDGVVNLGDLEVLEQNYGLVHGPLTIFEPLPHTDADPPIFIDLDETDQLPAGTAVEIPIVAGSADQTIQDIYGLAFTIELDPEVFNMGSVEILYPTSWFGEPDINTATIHEVYPDGRIEVALTRTDHNNVSGFGPIMHLRIIIDDIAGVEVPTEVVVKNVYGINHDEQPLVLRPGTSEAMVTKTTEDGFDRDALIASFGIFPNPTTDWVNFQNQYSMAPNRVDVFNAAGQHLSTTKAPGMKLDVSALPAGVYFLQIHLEGHIFTEKLVKLD